MPKLQLEVKFCVGVYITTTRGRYGSADGRQASLFGSRGRTPPIFMVRNDTTGATRIGLFTDEFCAVELNKRRNGLLL